MRRAILGLCILVVGALIPAAAAGEGRALTCAGQQVTIAGTPNDDLLYGTSGPDVIVAQGGNDVIFAKGGADIVCAGDGIDYVYGGVGSDTIYGGPGADIIYAGKGDLDRVFGGAGDDFIDAGSGNNKDIFGNDGRDRIRLRYNATGLYSVKGGPGKDTIDLRKSTVRADVRLDWVSPYYCFGPAPCIWPSGWLFSIENVLGTAFSDVIYGNDYKNLIKGSHGDDVIHGMGGNDRIFGNGGDDSLHGRTGDDWLDGGTGAFDTADGGADSNAGGIDQDDCYLVEFPSNCSIIFAP